MGQKLGGLHTLVCFEFPWNVEEAKLITKHIKKFEIEKKKKEK
jgi:hypothetical protein